MRVDGILFDKDGTLFDFRTTWNAWAAKLIRDLAEGQAETAQAIANNLIFDLNTNTFDPRSPVIAGSNREVAELIGAVLTDRPIEALEAHLTQAAAVAPLAPAVRLRLSCRRCGPSACGLG